MLLHYEQQVVGVPHPPTVQSTLHLDGLAPCRDYAHSCLDSPMGCHRLAVHRGIASTVHITLRLPQHPATDTSSQDPKEQDRFHNWWFNTTTPKKSDIFLAASVQCIFFEATWHAIYPADLVQIFSAHLIMCLVVFQSVNPLTHSILCIALSVVMLRKVKQLHSHLPSIHLHSLHTH